MTFTPFEQKCIRFNNNQTEVGSKLKTLKGSEIFRCTKFGVGKRVGNKLYFHRKYAEQVLIHEILLLEFFFRAESSVPFLYNIVRWEIGTPCFAFEECPGFDSESEPRIGKVVRCYEDGELDEVREYNSIFHHRWTMVDNNYTGFDVRESWEWSKKWLSVLREKAEGNSKEAWEEQLKRFNLS